MAAGLLPGESACRAEERFDSRFEHPVRRDDAAQGPGYSQSGLRDADFETDRPRRRVRQVSADDPRQLLSRYYVDYDKGFVIRPFDAKETPFELKINGRMQFRYSGFHSDVAGQDDRSNFEVERGRLEFRGFMQNPSLKYYINMDADTDDNHTVKFHDYWVNYKFNDAFTIYAGKGKVPASYTWYESSSTFRFADRDVATTFFRADRTVGVWAKGDLGEDKQFHYHMLVGNGLRSTDLEDEDVDELFVYSLMTWWNALGDVGKGFSDLKGHQNPAVRIGRTFSFANQNESAAGTALPEARWVRLGNGTRLTAPGALAPGVSVVGFDYYLYSLFLVAKYDGWSANVEFYYRGINNFDTTGGPSPDSDLEAHGFVAEVGRMIIAKRVELIARISGIDTSFGDTWEYTAGVNWFINGTHKNKLTFDVSVLDDLPAGSSSPNLEVGQDGLLFRAQYQVAF